jgi:hypothetical protein
MISAKKLAILLSEEDMGSSPIGSPIYGAVV